MLDVKGIQKCENYQNVLAFQDNRLVLGHLFPVTITQRGMLYFLLIGKIALRNVVNIYHTSTLLKGKMLSHKY